MKTSSNYLKNALMATLVGGLVACTTAPSRLDDLNQEAGIGFVRQVETSGELEQQATRYKRADLVADSATQHHQHLSESIITQGDTLRLSFVGMPSLDGLYQIDAFGNLDLPFGNSLNAAGNTRSGLTALIKQEMINSQWFYSDSANIDVSLVRLAPVNVAVLGAVFNPGRISINGQPANKPEDAIQNAGGAFSQGRDLVAALGASGGVRPDADLANIFLKRDGKVYQLDLASIISGSLFTATPSLNNGDVIFVATSGFENRQLIRPSQITPPGMRVFMSNLTAPALTNAQSAVGADATRLPYGSSLLDSAISANCVGGTQMANASRSIVLVTRNYGSTQQLVIKRSINELLANSSDASINPFVMPNDGVACYDSKFTNFRDVARGIGEVISPIIFGGLL
ncbi:MAG: hypothetical protein KTR16_01960 [Acidiferrobacterales bacterium]|nr:hypothetical protein [Acidiferrobacterales bacterium]